MAWDQTKSTKKNDSVETIAQFWNEEAQDYEELQGAGGATFTKLVGNINEEQIVTAEAVEAAGTHSVTVDVSDFKNFTVGIRASASHYFGVTVTFLNATGDVISSPSFIILNTIQNTISEVIPVKTSNVQISITNNDTSSRTYNAWLNGMGG